jgi:uncharacterized membrane-anchored protein YhcB (DUF1043 family)
MADATKLEKYWWAWALIAFIVGMILGFVVGKFMMGSSSKKTSSSTQQGMMQNSSQM